MIPTSASRPSNWKPRHAVLAFTGALALLLSGCTANTGDQEPAASSSASQAGGDLVYAVDAQLRTADPHQAGWPNDQSLARNIVDSLIDQDPDTHEFAPWLAESWEVLEDGRLFTFQLKDGVTFSDGTALTAEVVKQNFETILELGAKAARGSAALTGYESTTVIDDLNFEVRFSVPTALFLQALALPTLGILAPTTLETDPDARSAGTDIIGTGPFVLDSFDPRNGAKLVQREGYDWASPLESHEGDAYLDSVEYLVVEDKNSRIGSLQSGQVQGFFGATAVDLKQVPEPDYQYVIGYTPGNPDIIFINNQGPVTSDQAVRKALLVGIDRNEISNTLSSELIAPPATGVLTATTPGYVDQSAALAYDPDGARSSLENGGWTVGADGIREKDGQRLSISITFDETDDEKKQRSELLQSQLQEVGIELVLNLVTSAQASEKTASGDYELIFWGGTYADPDVLRTYYSVEGDNLPQLEAGTELETLLQQQVKTVDVDERNALLERIQDIIVDEARTLPIADPSFVSVFDANVHDVVYKAESRISFYNAWIED